MIYRLKALLSVLTTAWIVSCSSVGGAPTGQVWPPVDPRQPDRLVLAFPTETDPLRWWALNVQSNLPQDIYIESWYRDVAFGIVVETNAVRIENGLEPVVELEELNRVAQAHAFDQGIRDYWSHTTPEGLGSRLRIEAATGRQVVVGGENSSIGLTGNETAKGIVRGWLTHAGHRELLLNPNVKYIGVGVFQYAADEPAHFTQLLVDLTDPAP